MLAFFKNSRGVQAFFSQKMDGPMPRALELKDKTLIKNRAQFFKKNKFKLKKTVFAELIHGNRIGEVNEITTNLYPGVDGLITETPGICLAVTGADCPIVYFYDSNNKVIGICHAGWKGVIAGIVLEMLHKFKNLKSSLKNLKVAISPCIDGCHFEVGQEVVDLFRQLGFEEEISRKGTKIFINLKKVIKKQLTENGVNIRNIYLHPDCTYCEKDKYFSYRRGDTKEVMLAAIQLK